MKTLLVFFLATLTFSLHSSDVEAQGLSYQALKTCRHDYSDFLSNENNEMATVSELPPGIYLARSVVQSLERKNVRYISYQSFLSDSRSDAELCYSGTPSSAIKTKSLIPTLIDQSRQRKLGHTYWSFSSDLEKKMGASSSMRSLIPNGNYRKALEDQGYKILSMQKTHDEYQLRLQRDIASWKETIIVTYDQF